MENNEKELKVDKAGKIIPAPAAPIPEWKAVNQSNEKFVKFVPPVVLNKEVSWDKSKIIVSKTDAYGIIEYANEVFIEVSGYDEYELMGMPHNIIRHPDMPKVLFKVLWDNLKKGITVRPVVKNLAKSGRYYWVIADFEIKKNAKGEIINYYSRRKSVPQEVVDKVEGLYEKLLQIEKASGVSASEKYLMGFLEDKGKSYNELIEDLMIQYSPKPANNNMSASASAAPSDPVVTQEEKRGFFQRFFGKK